MTHDLELRVLTGLHHGAQCAAQDGALIGSHARCDVVLCDDGIAEEAVRLWIGNGSWRLSAHDDSMDTTPALPFGTPFPLGPIHVTVMESANPWPTPAELPGLFESAETFREDSMHDGMQKGKPEEEWPTLAAARNDQGHSRPRRPGLLTAQQNDISHPGTTRQRKGTEVRWAVGGLLILLVFGSVASFLPAGVRSSPRMETRTAADAETLLRVQHLLQEQGFSDRVYATITSDPEVLVTGWVRDQVEYDRLATILSKIWPQPTLRVDNETQATAKIVSQVQDLDMRVTASYPEAGRLAIWGITASDAVRSQAIERWRVDTAASPQVTTTLLLATQVGDAVNEAVTMAGLPRVTVSWKDKTLQIVPRGLNVSQREQLKAVVDTLNPTYMNMLHLNNDQAPKPESIPFRIHSVVGGEQPWVMLEDGTRIVIGGTHGAFRLKSIEDSSVVFDGPITAVIPR